MIRISIFAMLLKLAHNGLARCRQVRRVFLSFDAAPRGLCAILLLLAGCSDDPGLPSYGLVPDFTLTDQTGGKFRSQDALDGKVWVADFIFTNCAGPCPRMTSQMKQVSKAVQDRAGVRFVSFTIDPERDTPEVLAAYAARFRVEPDRWYFLTGPMADLHNLKRNAFFLGDVKGNLEHSTRFVLVDKRSRIRGFYDTSEPESIRKLIADIQDLTEETA
ncbi:MAG: SCO family protein [Bryobacteraceae bacterium]